MNHPWWWAVLGAIAYGAGRDLAGWWWRRWGKASMPTAPGWWRRRKARQDAPWDRALERNRIG